MILLKVETPVPYSKSVSGISSITTKTRCYYTHTLLLVHVHCCNLLLTRPLLFFLRTLLNFPCIVVSYMCIVVIYTYIVATYTPIVVTYTYIAVTFHVHCCYLHVFEKKNVFNDEKVGYGNLPSLIQI